MSAPVLTYAKGKGGIAVDLDRFVASRGLVQANSGGGKSRALRSMLEETHGRVQHLILDPEGEFSTLREKFDYVLAGKEGDVPATPKTARLLCRRLVELGTSAVIDLYDLSLHERREFVKLFLTELMALPRALWRPILVVIDEAHVFAPQTGESQSTDAVITLCTQGRKRGFCAVLATQRISKLHKDAAAELLNKLIGRTGLDVDVKRAGDELGLDKEGRRVLAQLQPGEFYAYGPAISNEIQIVHTGPVSTTHPEAGTLGTTPPPPSSKVKALLAKQLADLPKEAEDEARSIADLERKMREQAGRIRQLEKGGAERIVEKPVADPAAIARAHSQWTRELKKLIGRDMAAAGKAIDRVLALAGQLETAARDSVAALLALDGSLSPNGEVAVAVPDAVPIYSKFNPPPDRILRANVEPADGVSRPQQRMLNALASLAALGLEPAPRTTIAVLSDQSPRSSGFEKNMSTLRTAGLITYPDSDRMVLTDAGRAIAVADSTITSLADLHASWSNKVSGPQWRMCAALIQVYPDSMDRAALAAESNQSATSSGFEKNLSTLRTLGLISYPSSSEAIATALLMPKGLR